MWFGGGVEFAALRSAASLATRSRCRASEWIYLPASSLRVPTSSKLQPPLLPVFQQPFTSKTPKRRRSIRINNHPPLEPPPKILPQRPFRLFKRNTTHDSPQPFATMAPRSESLGSLGPL